MQTLTESLIVPRDVSAAPTTVVAATTEVLVVRAVTSVAVTLRLRGATDNVNA